MGAATASAMAASARLGAILCHPSPLPSDRRGAAGVPRRGSRLMANRLQIVARTFDADDFVLIRQMGGMTVRTRTSGFSMDEDDDASVLGDGKINFYSARFASNVMPQRPMLLKEFTGAAVRLAEEELRAYDSMLGPPVGPDGEGDVGWARSFGLQPGAGEPPLAPLLGSFRSRAVSGAESALQGLADFAEEMGATVDLDSVDGLGGGADALWLLSRVDRSLSTLADYPGAEQAEAPLFNAISLFGISLPGREEPRRHRFIRAVARGAVAALAWVHRRGLAHRSLSASCFLLSTLDDTEAARVSVRLSNFGLSLAGGGGPDEADNGDAQRVDRRALGLTIAELVFSALDARGPSPIPDMRTS